jgi:L-lactate dehydrogenase complex protein LldF
MTLAARAALRAKFLAAGLGISGVNFAVAETGTLVVVENEGNARLSTTLPRVHVALMGIEKVVPRAADLAVLLRLLTRSATGQPISTYVSFIGGPRPAGAADGPEAMHLVILDGGRSGIRADPRQRDSLHCIRCGVCLNYCPVYERIGGHAYGWVYPGPIGSVITPGLIGIDRSRDLPRASSLCGRCAEVCPVKIPLPDLLLARRSEDVDAGRPGPPRGERLAMRLFAMAAASPRLFGALRWGAGIFLRIALTRNPAARLFGPARAWTDGRNIPRPPAETFRAAWKRLEEERR